MKLPALMIASAVLAATHAEASQAYRCEGGINLTHVEATNEMRVTTKAGKLVGTLPYAGPFSSMDVWSNTIGDDVECAQDLPKPQPCVGMEHDGAFEAPEVFYVADGKQMWCRKK